MKNNSFRLILAFYTLILLVAIFSTSNYRVGLSYSVKEEDFTTLSMISDNHVSEGEKVFLNIDANIKEIKRISIDLTSKKELFTVEVEGTDTLHPYFVLPDYNESMIIGDKYYIDLIKVQYNNDYVEIISNNKEDNYRKINDNSYIIIDKKSDDFLWLDFNSLKINDPVVDNTGKVYVDLKADTNNIVSIEAEVTNEIDGLDNKIYIENIDNRPYFDIKDDLSLGTYEIQNINIYYNDGKKAIYSTSKEDNNYIDLNNNYIEIDKLLKDSSKNIEEKTTTQVEDNTEKIKKNTSKGLIWLTLIIVVIVAFVILFYNLKVEDDPNDW